MTEKSIFLTLWMQEAYIYAPASYFSPREAYIYMYTIETPSAQSYEDCGVNSCLLHKSGPHVSLYITTQEGQEGAVLLCEQS